jgi:hypothetical protein
MAQTQKQHWEPLQWLLHVTTDRLPSALSVLNSRSINPSLGRHIRRVPTLYDHRANLINDRATTMKVLLIFAPSFHDPQSRVLRRLSFHSMESPTSSPAGAGAPLTLAAVLSFAGRAEWRVSYQYALHFLHQQICKCLPWP